MEVPAIVALMEKNLVLVIGLRTSSNHRKILISLLKTMVCSCSFEFLLSYMIYFQTKFFFTLINMASYIFQFSIISLQLYASCLFCFCFLFANLVTNFNAVLSIFWPCDFSSVLPDTSCYDTYICKWHKFLCKWRSICFLIFVNGKNY